MSNPIEDQLRLELATAQLQLAQSRLQYNLSQQSLLQLAHCAQATMHYLHLPGAYPDSDHFRELSALLMHLATIHIAQIHQSNVPQNESTGDPYDLRTLSVDMNTPNASETCWENED